MRYKVVIKQNVRRVGEHRKIPRKKIVEILLDARIPKKYHKPIIFHEETEDRLQRNFHLIYSKAHKIATAKEKAKFFKRKKKSWHNEISEVSRLFNSNKKYRNIKRRNARR